MPYGPDAAAEQASEGKTGLLNQSRQQKSPPANFLTQRVGHAAEDSRRRIAWESQQQGCSARILRKSESFSQPRRKCGKCERTGNQRPRRNINRQRINYRDEVSPRFIFC